MAGVLRISSTARCDCGPATITTELVSPGFWRKATPNPTASSNGKTNTQNMTSGSRHISVKRVFTNCRKAIQRALPRGPAVGAGSGVVLETAGWVSVAIAQISNFELRISSFIPPGSREVSRECCTSQNSKTKFKISSFFPQVPSGQADENVFEAGLPGRQVY